MNSYLKFIFDFVAEFTKLFINLYQMKAKHLFILDLLKIRLHQTQF